MATSEFEVYLTPDIDIKKNMSMDSATSSVHAETGAPAVKHLHTFSQEGEENEDIDLSNLSICSTDDEVEVTPMHEKDAKTTNAFYSEEEDTENCPPGRYRRPRDSFGKCQEPAQNQRKMTTSVPPTKIDERELILKEFYHHSSPVSPQTVSSAKKGRRLNVEVIAIDANDDDISIPNELDPRSPRVLDETRIKLPQNVLTEKKK